MTAAMPHRCWPEGFPHPRQGDPDLLSFRTHHVPRSSSRHVLPPVLLGHQLHLPDPLSTPVSAASVCPRLCCIQAPVPGTGLVLACHSSLRNHGCCLKPRELLSGYCRPRFWKVHPVLARFATSPFPPEVSCSKVQARLFLKHGRLTSVLCLKSGLGLPVTRPLLLARADLTCAVTATTHRTRHVTSRV